MNKETRSKTRRHPAAILLGSLLAACLLLVVIPYLATDVWPNLGAQAADVARAIFGDQVVAAVENAVLQSQDQLKQWTQGAASVPTLIPLASPPTPSMTASPENSVPGTARPPASVPTATAWIASPTPQEWMPPPVASLDPASSEGQWNPYLWDPAGQTVGYRTDFHPDPERIYAHVAVVAFDLENTRLHFVLGYQEPASSLDILRSGRIPADDLQPGRLLAAFNGGFKAQHGHFGVMANGITLIQPREGLGTVGIYDGGEVRIGVWGKDLGPSPHLIAWRQNGPLIVQDGQVNPHTADRAPQDWGITVYGETATFRSSLGISADGRTLYYAAGPSLTLPVLARAMLRSGAAQAIQLDINNFWVHFEAFQVEGDTLKAVPLLDEMKGVGDHRYLVGFSRDYFYVTTK